MTPNEQLQYLGDLIHKQVYVLDFLNIDEGTLTAITQVTHDDKPIWAGIVDIDGKPQTAHYDSIFENREDAERECDNFHERLLDSEYSDE